MEIISGWQEEPNQPTINVQQPNNVPQNSGPITTFQQSNGPISTSTFQHSNEPISTFQYSNNPISNVQTTARPSFKDFNQPIKVFNAVQATPVAEPISPATLRPSIVRQPTTTPTNYFQQSTNPIFDDPKPTRPLPTPVFSNQTPEKPTVYTSNKPVVTKKPILKKKPIFTLKQAVPEKNSGKTSAFFSIFIFYWI